MEALRWVGFGANDYLVEFEGEVEGAGAAVLECDKCGELCRILAQEDGGWAIVLETLGGVHVRKKAVEEGQRHVVRIKFVVYCD